MLSMLVRRSAGYQGRADRVDLRKRIDIELLSPQSVMTLLVAGRAQLYAGKNASRGVPLFRAWNHVADWLMLGGVLVMPVAAVIAAIGAMTPANSAVHQHTGDFFAFAALWFFLALLASQFQRRRHGNTAVD